MMTWRMENLTFAEKLGVVFSEIVSLPGACSSCTSTIAEEARQKNTHVQGHVVMSWQAGSALKL
jgi:hypothetical protein